MNEKWKETFDQTRPVVVEALAESSPADDRIAGLLDAADEMKKSEAAGVYAAILDVWLDGDRRKFRWARKAADGLSLCVKRVRTLDPGPFVDYLAGVFRHTGYLKDYKALWRLARRLDEDVLVDVDDVIREELPDIWIERALERGDVEEAVECWYEHEDHSRARLCADELLEVAGDRVDIVVSGRLSVVNYYVGRGRRRHYRKAGTTLIRLRTELEDLDELSYWPIVLEDVATRHGHRRALVDELEKLGIRLPIEEEQ